MLKLWKQTWRARGQNTDRDAVSSASVGSSPIPAAVDAPSSDNITLPPAEPVPPATRAKRPRNDEDVSSVADPSYNRPTKQLKLDDGNGDLLRNHLPEVSESDPAYAHALLDLAEFRKSILDQAKLANSIGFLPKLSAVATICYDFLKWAVEVERSRRLSPEASQRIALLVMEKESSVEARGLYIQNALPQISCFSMTSSKGQPTSQRDLLGYDIIVISSQRLLECLHRGLLQLQAIHALVLDDAQHLKNQDCHSFLPAVQIMRTFYFPLPVNSRPRIFAVAVSSSTSRIRFDSKMLRLETTLDARVCGVAEEKRKEILDLPDRPNETIVFYDKPPSEGVVQTRLYKQLQDLDPDMTIIRKHYRIAELAVSEIGTCASDLIWRRAQKEIEAGLPVWHEDDDNDDDDGTQTPRATRLRIRDAIKNWTFAMPNLNPSSQGFNVTHKFLRLIQVLEACATYGEGFRGIIFVQRRAIAFVLAELLRTLNDRLPFIRPAAICGSMGFQVQQDIFANFASGVYSLLIATKSVEELGVPKASVVIRYDLFESQLSHAQMRACTCGRESHLIHLVERNNDAQRRILANSSSSTADMVRWMDTIHRSTTISIPPIKLNETQRPYHSDSEDDDQDAGKEYILDATTSGRIYAEDATTALIRIASVLSSQNLMAADHSLFQFSVVSTNYDRPPQYICTISLPGTPADGVKGPPALSRYLARRCASFAACKRLSDLGLLDYQIVPIPASLLPKEQLPMDLNEPKVAGTRRYPRKYPDFWKNANIGPVSTLYPTVIHAESQGTMYSPLVLLTRQPLPPSLPSVNLFSLGIRIVVHFRRAAPFNVDDEKNAAIHGFTLRVFRSCLNKPIACSVNDMPYFLGALSRSWEPPDTKEFVLPEIVNDIDWNLMVTASHRWVVPIDSNSVHGMERDLFDAVIQDRWLEFTRRYHVVKLRRDLTPLSKPADSPREKDYKNLLAYVTQKRHNFSGLQDLHQPIVQVAKVLTIFNNLNPRVKDLTPPSKAETKYLIPELCAKFILSSSVMQTALILPSIMWKLDDLLVVKELNTRFFDNIIQEDLLYAAITSVSAGMDFDYERLELLGDAFLKYLSSIFVFVTYPTQNEGSLHVARQKLISNKALLQNSLRIGLPVYVRSKVFNTKSWLPPNYTVLPLISRDKKLDNEGEDPVDDDGAASAQPSEVAIEPKKSGSSHGTEAEEKSPQALQVEPGEEAETSGQTKKKKKKAKRAGKQAQQGDDTEWQTLGDKAIADVAEAIIGAAYISGGRECALRVVKILTVPISGINTWSDFGSRVVIPFPNTVAQLRPGSVQAVEEIIGHKFQQPHLLGQAMSHTSVRGNEMTSYERLEFIGDAILDFMVIRHIYDRDNALSPGALTLLKSAMVSNATLAAICVSSGLYKHLLFESLQLSNSIHQYAALIEEKAKEEYKNAKKEKRNPGQYWLDDIEAPKILSDVIESLIGSVYISDNFSPVGAEAFFDNVLKPFFDKHITLSTLTHHPTKTLFELIQAHGCQLLKITRDPNRKMGLTTCHVTVHDRTLASESDISPTSAARKASLAALERFREDVSILTDVCDCRTRPQSKNTWISGGFEQALSVVTETEEQSGE